MRFVPFVALAAPVLAQLDAKPKPPGKPEKPGKPHDKPKKLVTPKDLIKDIKLEDLLEGSQQLQTFADEAGGNRAFGSTGHNATTEWLYQTLLATGYYDVYKQPFVELFTAATTKFTAAGEEIPVSYMTYGPSGDVTANIVKVNNLPSLANWHSSLEELVRLLKRPPEQR